MKWFSVLFLLFLGFENSSYARPERNEYFELSGTFSYSQSNFGGTNFEWTRRYMVSFGYYFLAMSEIEFSVQDNFDRTKIDGVADTAFHDQIYSLDWVQSLLPRHAAIQPYVKLGIGELNRTASGTYASGDAPPSEYDALTIVMGIGMRIFAANTFAIKGEATTYLLGGQMSSWQNNLAFNVGISFYF